MAINNGGPAYPQWDGHAITSEPMYLRGGMTLRDYFAAAALAGLPCEKESDEIIAAMAYSIADAMLKARPTP